MSTYLEEFKKRDPFQMVDDKTKNAILKLMANDKQKNAQGTNYAGSYTGISIPQNGNNKFAPKPIKPTTQKDPFLEGLRDKEKNTQKPTKKDAKG